jgi:hypothetical protein
MPRPNVVRYVRWRAISASGSPRRMQQGVEDLRELPPFRGVVAQALHVEPRELVPERVVHGARDRDIDLEPRLGDEVVPPEVADRIASVLLDRQPEGILDLALLGVREPHQHIVVDEFVVAQRCARRVEALEDLLRVRLLAEGDRDMLEPLQAPPDVLDLVGRDLAAEERVVVVEARVAQALTITPVEHDALVELSPRAVGAQLRAGTVVRAHQHRLELRGERGIRHRFRMLQRRVVQRRDQQHEGCDALLPVDEHELARHAIQARGREDRAEEVGLQVIAVGDRTDVGEQLFASVDVPAILTLVDGHHDAHIWGGEPTNRVHCGRVDVRGGVHRCGFTPC